MSTRPYTVSERLAREIPDGSEWRRVYQYVVVDDHSQEVTTADDRPDAQGLADLLNDAYERGRAHGAIDTVRPSLPLGGKGEA